MIYFDNASTTKIKDEVIAAISQSMAQHYGNPSSTHSLGRTTKAQVENVRTRIAKAFNCKAKEIIFTSGATEADNSIIDNAVNNLGVKRIISSKLEHHAVSETIEQFEKKGVEIVWLDNDTKGNIDLNQLEDLLKKDVYTLVSLMYVNNEIGNINDISKIAELCKENGAIYHSDTVQGIPYFKIDLAQIPVDFICASAHKFGGPKGVGFMFKREGVSFAKQVFGGEQERNFRAGTENLHSIVGMGKAIEVLHSNLEDKNSKLLELKKHFLSKVDSDEIEFNGNCNDFVKSAPHIVNIHLKNVVENKLLVFNFDIKKIAISEGSACASGRNLGSRIVSELGKKSEKGQNIRVSFGEDNTREEIDTFFEVLNAFIEKNKK
jgi:cysteine desulfurase